MSTTKVCVIGAGPAGMATLYQFTKLPSYPEIVCFEKQATWGGLWNFSWRTGTDEYGEACHSGMYRNLWTNAPKEVHEYPDYSFEEHYGRPVPSFPSREVFRDYLEGRFTRKASCDLKQFIRFSTAVKHVQYNSDSDDFSVTVRNLKDNVSYVETFSHVVTAVGIFNYPRMEYIDGIDTFIGRVIHSHNFRDAREFKGLRVLAIGSKYSAEDIALQTIKFGGKQAIVAWRKKPMGYKWPAGIEERPSVVRFDSNKAYFQDGSCAEVDVVVFCTGYLYNFPFMEERLRLKATLSLYPDNLYKGVLWVNGGNNKLFYIGAQDEYFSFTLFDVQASWVCRYITRSIPTEPVSSAEMRRHIDTWLAREKTLTNIREDLTFQGDYLTELCEVSGYSLDVKAVADMFCQWSEDKKEDVATFRDKSFRCIATKTQAPYLHTPWMQVMDSSVENFLK